MLLAAYHLIARAAPVQGDTAYQIISSRSVPTTRPSLSASPLSSAAHVPGDARGDAARIDLALVCRLHVRVGINKGLMQHYLLGEYKIRPRVVNGASVNADLAEMLLL